MLWSTRFVGSRSWGSYLPQAGIHVPESEGFGPLDGEQRTLCGRSKGDRFLGAGPSERKDLEGDEGGLAEKNLARVGPVKWGRPRRGG